MIDGRLLAYRRGGIQRYVHALCRELGHLTQDCTFRLIINRAVDNAPLPTVRVRTPPHHRLESITFGGEVAIRRPAVLHSPDFIPPIAPGVRRVITIHDLAFIKSPELLSRDAYRYYGQLPRVVHRADQIIAVSDATAHGIVEYLGVPHERITTIYNGVDPLFFVPHGNDSLAALSSELGPEQVARLSSDRPKLLIVGTIEPRKRHELILDALDAWSCAQSHERPLLIVAGQPGWQAGGIIDRIRQYEHSGQVMWIQGASDHGLKALYQVATCLVMPSRDEGFGLPVLEAMACGCPVVASTRGALPEIVADAGILVSEDDPERWATTLQEIIEDESRRLNLAVRGTEHARQFRWERTAMETLKVYRKAMAR